MKKLLIAGLFISLQAFSGGLEPDPKPTDAKIAPSPVKSSDSPAKAVEETVTKAPADCKPPSGGNSVINHGAVTNGGDSVGTKVICACEAKACKAKTVEKQVPGPVQWRTKTVTKNVPGPVQYLDKPCPSCPDKPCPTCPKADCGDKGRNFTLGILAGSGPDGIHPYKYDKEYRAREGRGILMGLDVDYRFLDRFHVGALYINNDTYMGRLGISF